MRKIDFYSVEDGGDAFPTFDLSSGPWPGMSLRDWFAGQALAGLCANSSLSLIKGPTLARDALDLAEAMIEERARRYGGAE